jgi:signal transduction histidine kinase
MKIVFSRLSLSKQFLALSFPILFVGTLVTGWWIGEQVKDSVVHRTGAVTALYVASFIAPHLQSLADASELSRGNLDAMHSDLATTPLGQKIVALKIWRKDGLVLFSNDLSIQGKMFPVGEGLAQALVGNIFAEMSERTQAEQIEHGQPQLRLIETYTPIRADRTGDIIAAAEFYIKPDDVDREAAIAMRRGWLLVAGVMLSMYMLLFAVVYRGSRKIIDQQGQLNEKIIQLTEANTQNTQLQIRVIRAAERATAVNEDLLQRISADIHDGPVQDLGFALMQLKNLDDVGTAEGTLPVVGSTKNLKLACNAVQSALTDLRAISSDLNLPDVGQLGLIGIVERVIRDFQTKTEYGVVLVTSMPRVDATFRVKVTVYRVLQESLANAFRHANGAACEVTLTGDTSELKLEISDKGPGFEHTSALTKGRFGLHGMRQRVEVLGGSFELQSTPGVGTKILIKLPLNPTSIEYG